MFIFNLTYVKEIPEVERLLPAHINYLDKYYKSKDFICSGRKIPRTGGIILCNSATREEAEKIMKQDPFFINQIAEYEIVEFIPSKSLEAFQTIIENK